MNTGYTVYEQLQEILNKCIELSIREPSKYSNKVKCTNGGISYNEHQEYDCYMSYHDVFSKDNGLMEFVEWEPLKKASSIQLKILYEYGIKDYNYMMMSLLTAEEKCLHFISNAIVGKKQ